MLSSSRVVAGLILVVQLGVLAIGITRDYQLKHEDNNALHATFARAHLQLGLTTTKAQNFYYTPAIQTGTFYANHPPGPGLVLAAVYGLTGADGPVVTRATAITFHLVSTILFLGLARRVVESDTRAVGATLVFVLLPESAFFGRMLNHEVLVLCAGLLLVRAYWEALSGSGTTHGWLAAMVVASVLAAYAGWAGFFVIGACGLHAVWVAVVRRERVAWGPAVALVILGSGLFVVIVTQLASVQGTGLVYFRDLLSSRMAGAEELSWSGWLGRVLELHWRYFSLTGGVALVFLAARASRSLRSASAFQPWAEVGLIFLVAGLGYVVVFNVNAARHDYWQFLLLPASALAIAQVVASLAGRAAHGPHQVLWKTLLVLVCVELTVTAGVTLAQRHLKTEAYCLETVQVLRRDAL